MESQTAVRACLQFLPISQCHGRFNNSGTFSAGERYYREKLNETLACAARLGYKNMVFVTLTANELDFLAAFIDDGKGAERPDVTCRSFNQLKDMVLDWLKQGMFLPEGQRVCADYGVAVMEFQKRGLPHVHYVLHFPGDAWTADLVLYTLCHCTVCLCCMHGRSPLSCCLSNAA